MCFLGSFALSKPYDYILSITRLILLLSVFKTFISGESKTFHWGLKTFSFIPVYLLPEPDYFNFLIKLIWKSTSFLKIHKNCPVWSINPRSNFNNSISSNLLNISTNMPFQFFFHCFHPLWMKWFTCFCVQNKFFHSYFFHFLYSENKEMKIYDIIQYDVFKML